MNLLMRAYHGYKNLNQENKIPVSMLYGSLTMLVANYLKTGGEIHFCLEGKNGVKRRRELLSCYKEGRGGIAESEKDLIFAETVFALKCIPSFWHQGSDMEADDIIASLVEMNKNKKISILSTDKDLWALVGKKVCCLGMSGVITEDKVFEKMGVQPNKLPIWKSIFGDPSDKIPRLPKLRAKKMMDWIEASSCIEDLLKMIPNAEMKKTAKTNYKVVSFHKGSFSTVESVGSEFDLKKHLQFRDCPSLLKKVEEFWSPLLNPLIK